MYFPDYPTIHSSKLVTWQRLANHSLLYGVRGTDASLKPYLLMAHTDVVPADSQQWVEPPFGGNEREGYIYGRGAIDDKQMVFVCK